MNEKVDKKISLDEISPKYKILFCLHLMNPINEKNSFSGIKHVLEKIKKNFYSDAVQEVSFYYYFKGLMDDKLIKEIKISSRDKQYVLTNSGLNIINVNLELLEFFKSKMAKKFKKDEEYSKFGDAESRGVLEELKTDEIKLPTVLEEQKNIEIIQEEKKEDAPQKKTDEKILDCLMEIKDTLQELKNTQFDYLQILRGLILSSESLKIRLDALEGEVNKSEEIREGLIKAIEDLEGGENG